eukprot:scaffold9948_cov129-Cylindrotheca_fusiformis.AAC.6
MFPLYGSPSAEPEPSEETNSSTVSEDKEIPPQHRGHDSDRGTVETVALPPASSWSEAHRRYCQKHGVLRASIRSVTGELSEDVDYELPWELPTRAKVVTTIDGLIKPSSQSSKAQESSVIWQKTKQLASSLASVFFQDDLEESTDWQQHDDNAILHDPSTGMVPSLDWDALIIEVELTNQCLKVVETAIRNYQSQNSSFWILNVSEWNEWCSSQKTDDMLARLSSADTQWLLEVLVEKGLAKIVKRDHAADLVVLSHELPNSEASSTNVDVAVALHDMKRTQHKLECQIEDWVREMQESRKKAVRHKRQNQVSLAIMQLKRSKLLQHRIHSSTQAMLKLEETQATIEMTQSNQVVLKILAQSSEQLRKLTQQTPIDQVESVTESLQYETEKANDIQDALASSNPSSDTSDEDLWRELESLALEDSNPSAPDNGPAQKLDLSTVPKKKTSIEKGKVEEKKSAVLA